MTPTTWGRQQLTISVSALYDIEERPSKDKRKRAVKVFEQTIEIEVTYGKMVQVFVSGNWQWLWTTLAVPIATFLWARAKWRSKSIANANPKGHGVRPRRPGPRRGR